MSRGPTAQWLRKVGEAALDGLSEADLRDRGFAVALASMSAALTARNGQLTDSSPQPSVLSNARRDLSTAARGATPIKGRSERSEWP